MSDQYLLPSEEQEYYEQYFQKIESLFAALRGRGILLSPADYQLARSWYDKGIPLSCALRGIRAAFYKKMSEGDDIEEEILSLSWCKWAVNQEWKEYKAVSTGEESPFQRLEVATDASDDTSLLLESMLFDLQKRAADFNAQGLVDISQLITSFADLLGKASESSDIETVLEQLDSEMLEAMSTAIDETEKQKLLKAVERKLKPFKDKMSEEAYMGTRNSAFRDRLRQAYALPKLTLHSLNF